MERIICNLAGPARRSVLNGVECTIIPMVMMVEGVLNGSNGALLYPAAELKKSAPAWNMKPIMLGHPTNSYGVNVSARSPEMLAASCVGVILNAKCGDNGKLVAEAWLDNKRADELDPRILQSIANNQQMEVSTGLFTENEQRSGEFHGKRYSAIARNYQPDHLALLPDQLGACSIQDGCGTLRTNERFESDEEPLELPRLDFGPKPSRPCHCHSEEPATLSQQTSDDDTLPILSLF